MTIDSPIDRIDARRKKLGEDIARLQSELNDLDTALKVLRQFDEPPRSPAAEDAKLGPPRPSGTPTNFEMVDMILAGAEREGKDGLTVPEIIAEMRSRYWPGLKDVQVSAPIYSFARKGRFKKTPSGKFKRIKTVAAQLEEMGVPTSDDAPAHVFVPERR